MVEVIRKSKDELRPLMIASENAMRERTRQLEFELTNETTETNRVKKQENTEEEIHKGEITRLETERDELQQVWT